MAGAFVPIVSVPLIIILLVAMLTVHLSFGFSLITLKGMNGNVPQYGTPGDEVKLLYTAGLLTLA